MKEQYLSKTAFIVVLSTITNMFALLARADEYDFDKILKKNKALEVLSLEVAMEEALENNALLKANKADATAKKARIIPSGALDDPMLEAAVSNYPINSLSARESGMTGNEVMLVQKFPFPGKREKLKEFAAYEHKASSEEVERIKLDLIRSVKTTYYDLFLSYKREEVLHNQHKLLRNVQSVAQNKYALGTTSQIDIFELQIKAANLLVLLQEEEKKIAAKRAALNHLLGREVHYSIWRPETIKESRIDSDRIAHDFAQQEATNNNPKIRTLDSLRKAADSKVSYTELNTYPDFQVGVGYMQRFSNRDDDGADFVTARVGINLPIWQRTKQKEEQREARADRSKMEALLQEGKIELSHDIHKTIAELTEAKNKIGIFRKALLPLADASITSGLKAYEANDASYLTVLNLINSRFEAENGYYEALVQQESALAMLETLIATPISNFIMKSK